MPFQTIGVDYAGPIKYRQKKLKKKAYILLYSCSLTRAVYLDLLPDLSTEEFIQGRDKVVRGAKLRAGKSTLERLVQHLFPLELSCDILQTIPQASNEGAKLDVRAPEFRPRQKAAEAARGLLKTIAEAELQGNDKD